MRRHRFYTPLSFEDKSTIEVDGGPALHMARVLRMKQGDQVELFNGTGGYWQGSLVAVEKRKVTVALENFFAQEVESHLNIHLGQALSKGERMDYVIQKATELGLHSLSPLYSERCEVKLAKEREQKRLNHWQQIAISACEQCLRNQIPQIKEPSLLNQWIKGPHQGLKLILSPTGQRLNLNTVPKPESISLLIGPEGGFSANEVEQASQAGFLPLAIGPRILRTETAPVVALSVLQSLWGDFH